MSTCTQKRAELKRLSKATKQNIFDMLRLASDLLANHAYVDSIGGEDVLLEQLTSDEFSHFGGKPSVAAMVRAYRSNPSLSTWKEHGFNIQAMIALSDGEGDNERAPRKAWKSMHAEAVAYSQQLLAQLQQAQAEIARLNAVVAERDARIQSLTVESSRLRGRLEAVENRHSQSYCNA